MKKNGFTLLEVILTLVISSVFLAMMVSYFGPYITKSTVPISNIQSISDANAAMSDITNIYNKFVVWTPSTSYEANDVVVPTIANGFYYTCATAGVSGGSEPTDWLKSSTINDGTVKWTKSSVSVLEYLASYATSHYSAYTKNNLPGYTTDFSDSDSNIVLKVILKTPNSGTIVSYFTNR